MDNDLTIVVIMLLILQIVLVVLDFGSITKKENYENKVVRDTIMWRMILCTILGSICIVYLISKFSH